MYIVMAKAMSITSKYQVTVPKEVRDVLNIHQKDSLIFSVKDGKVSVSKAPSLEDIQRRAQLLMKKHGVQHVSDEDMSKAREIFHAKNLKW